jgi:hypothetical protein
VDNLFVFVVIMARFSVPREYQQKVLLVGIVLALVMRGIFIAVGAAAISAFSGKAPPARWTTRTTWCCVWCAGRCRRRARTPARA